jgi:predicted ester cyclase
MIERLKMTSLNSRLSTVLAFVFVMLLFSCKEMHEEHDDDMDDVSSLTDAEFETLWGNIDTLWEQKDVSLAGNVYAESFTRISPGGTSTSYDELANELNAIKAAYPDMTLDLESYDLCGNMAVVHWSVNGSYTGEMVGIKGNGKPFSDVTGVTIIFVEDGKIVKDDSYWDTFAVFAQAGYSISEPVMENDE